VDLLQGGPSPGGRIAGVAEAHPLAVLRRSIDDARIDDGESCTSALLLWRFAPDHRHAPLLGRLSHGHEGLARSRNMALVRLAISPTMARLRPAE
jgi:hypothetical protein